MNIHMKLIVIFLYITISSLIFSCSSGSKVGPNTTNYGNIRITFNPSETPSEVIKIAVFPFNTSAAIRYESQGPSFADQYIKDFQQIGYSCIDRKTISKAMKEQSLNPNGPIDLNTAISIGKTLGAKGIVLGEVTTSQGEVTTSFMGEGFWWHYSIRLVNVDSGQFVWIVDASDVYRGEIAKRLKTELDRYPK